MPYIHQYLNKLQVEYMRILSLHISNTTNMFISCGLQKKGFFLSTRFQVFVYSNRQKLNTCWNRLHQLDLIFFTIFETALEQVKNQVISQSTIHSQLITDTFHHCFLFLETGRVWTKVAGTRVQYHSLLT